MLNKISEYMEDASKRYNITMAKIDAYTEGTMKQLEINCAKARLKVMTEGGTGEDLVYLQEGAVEDSIDKIKKAIDKIIEAFKKFCNEVKLRVLSLITSKETKENVDKIEKKVKLNPFLSKKKVQVADKEKSFKVTEWANAQYQKILSKIKSGKEVTAEEIDAVEDEARSRFNVVAGAGALVTTTLAGAIAILKKAQTGIGSEVDKAKKGAESILAEVKKVSGEAAAKAGSNLKKLGASAANTGKSGVQAVFDWIRSTLTVIRGAVGGAISKVSGNTKDVVAESVSDEFLESMAADLLNETTSYLDQMEEDLFGENSYDDTFEESSDDFDYDSWLNETSGDLGFMD